MGRRVIPASSVAASAADPTIKGRDFAPAAATATADDYASRLVKYVPAEIITMFVTLNGMVAASAADKPWLQWAVFGILLLITPLYTNHVTKAPGMPPAYKQIGIATAAFVLWVFAIGGPFTLTAWYDNIYGSLLLPLYTFLVPMFDDSGASPLNNNPTGGDVG